LGVCRLGCRQGLSAQVAEYLCRTLLDRWAGPAETPGGENPARELRLKRLVSELIGEFELEADSLVSRCRETIEQALPPASQTALEQLAGELLERTLHDAGTPSAARWQTLAQQICQALGAAPGEAEASLPTRIELKQAMESLHAAQLKKIDRGLSERIAAAADESDLRLSGAKSVADLLTEYLRSLDHELAVRLQQVQQRLTDHGQTPPELPAASTRKVRKLPELAPVSTWGEHLVAHGRLLLAEWAVLGARRLVQALLLKSQPVSESLINLRRDAQGLAKQFESTPPWAGSGGKGTPSAADDPSIDRAILRELQSRFENLAGHFEQIANQELLTPCGGLIRLLTAGEQRMRLLPTLLRSLAQCEITQALKEIDVARLVLGPLTEPDAARDSLDRFVQAAWPRLLSCGGAKRLLLLMPPCATAERLPRIVAQQRQETPSVLLAPGGDLVACYEAEQIPLAAAAASLVREDPQCAAAAQRLHTRTDIEWSVM
jgi:hypothetical protein